MSLDKTILGEMLAHVPLTVYPEPKKVLLLSEVGEIQKEVEKHGCEISKDLVSDEGIFDVVISDSFASDDIVKIFRSLKQDGIAVFKCADWKEESETLKEQLKSCELFRYAMPYRFENYTNGADTVLFVSKKYHPTADMKLQIADMLEDLSFYNGDLHKAVFEIPNFIFADLKPLLKL